MRALLLAVLQTSLVVAALAAALVLEPASEQPSPGTLTGSYPLSSYVFEARVDFPDRPASSPYVVIRSWYEAPKKTRWELTCGGDPRCDDTPPVTILAVDGDVWFYQPATNSYTRSRDEVLGLSGWPYPLLSNFQPGPLASEPPGAVQQDGIPKKLETMLGIRVTNYCDALWIDDEHTFLLRQVGADAGGSRFIVQVTQVQYNPKLAPSIFRFMPPPGASERAPAIPSTPVTVPTPSPNATRLTITNPSTGFLAPSYLPPCYGRSGTGSTTSRTEVTAYDLRFRSLDGLTSYSIHQQKVAMNQTIAPVGTPVSIGSSRAYISENGESRTLTWITADLKVTIDGNGVARDELLRVAESMR